MRAARISCYSCLTKSLGVEGGYEPESHHSIDPDTERQHIANHGARSDIALKRFYATGVFWILGIQIVLVDAVFIAKGIGCLTYSDYELHLFLSGTLLQVFGIVWVITKHLFKGSGAAALATLPAPPR